MKKYLALLGAYAAGVTVMMKIRKDNGSSKLAGEAKDITAGNVVDEIVDIHKTIFDDVKNRVVPFFEDAKDLDGLKKKVSVLIENFSLKVEEAYKDIQAEGASKQEIAIKILDDAREKAQKAIDTAKEKALTFGDEAREKLPEWSADIEQKLEKTYRKLKAKIEKMTK